ncbi:hypothetical protein QJS04_geneDACA003460 [Acorus gramineus]|uniref:Uncharacterized protein n=1 Tax=Acorus gramineus TaxID=55184 RepID=A0AAV9BNE3_ACOGR|nr:hypothetical protein QJS04_geneDACA003460 [Acorus gramineus]
MKPPLHTRNSGGEREIKKESRSLALMDEGMSSLDMVDQMDNGGGALEVDELGHGRMDIESNDYPGSGANNRHDPKSPGRP